MGFLEVISRRLLLEIRRRRFRAPAATCYDSKRSLLPRSFSGLKLFFRSSLSYGSVSYVFAFCTVRISWIFIMR